jgi:tetratricopeptide (TPR) repeat protein
VLGVARIEDVPGSEIAAIYHHFVRTGDFTALEPVVEHNRFDVVSMMALVSLYGEPLEAWACTHDARDVAAASFVAKRAGDLDRALAFAEASVSRGGGPLGHRARGDVAKARGDKALALADYEKALEALPKAGEGEDDKTASSLRLELAKLYEHHARAYDKALGALANGTVERPEHHERRIRRLVTKLEAHATGRPTRKSKGQNMRGS